ncbi:hypothetical protein PIB30_001103 [Stylosanthes scabra]|uniref:IST1-like protein n=1 Tax=Stylosanthes scabra TaxID=79078 RepID=A0ABU6U476_9FABA|nr:hypothetical protein [Stylosanthes scabra]
MFHIFFGWSKASKCKRAMKQGRCRLKLLKNKREAIARQLRKDVAELVHCGHDETALNRVEQLIEDESLVATYELLDHYCELVLTQLSYIRRHKECPNDINEAVSSLIYASARCGEIPELCVIRKLFGERYGDKFVVTAMELLPENLVNNQLKENLSGNPVSDDLKFRKIDEIVGENCTQEQVLAIQYYPSWQQEQDKEVDLSMSNPNDLCSSPKSTLIDVSAIVPALQKCPPYKLEDYGGDIEEIEFSVSKNGTCFQDQTLFKFRTSGQSKREDKETEIACYESDTDRHESSSEKSSIIRAYRKSKRGSEVKRPRRRSASFESIGIMDIGYMVYYHKPSRSLSSYKHGTRRLRKKQHTCQSEEDGDKQKNSIKATHMHQALVDEYCDDQPFPDDLVTTNMVQRPMKANRKSYSDETKHDFVGSKEIEAECSVSVGNHGSSNYLRVMSMPEERKREKMVRAYSCPNHVHPKLPEYDDIAAKFTALKRECQESKVQQ